MQDHTPTFPENISGYAPWVSKHGLLEPYGKCQCGCGQDTKPSEKDRPREDNAKGEPRRFAIGHRAFARTKEEAFWKYVTPQDSDSCWLWQSSTSSRGYGKFTYKGKTHAAHRFSYELHHGPLNEGQMACHTCDNPACCNPHHLFAGTPLDNVIDKMEKGRHRWAKGKESPHAKLSEQDVRNIRNLREQGLTQREIAERFGIGQAQVHRIVHYQRWAHVT